MPMTYVALPPGPGSQHILRSLEGHVANVSKVAVPACVEGRPPMVPALLPVGPPALKPQPGLDSLGWEHCLHDSPLA